MRRGDPPRPTLHKGLPSQKLPSMSRPAGSSVKYNLPSTGFEPVKFELSGFKEMSQFKDPKLLSRPPPSSMQNYKLNTKPGRSINKFNFRDLPQDIDFDHELFKAEDYFEKDEPNLVALRAQAINNLKKDSRKPGGGLYGVRKPVGGINLTPARGKAKQDTGTSDDGNYFIGETVLSDTERIREELLKVRQNIRNDVEKDLGFGFRWKQQGSIQRKIEASLAQEMNGGNKDQEPIGKKTDKSVKALQEKIQQRRQQIKEMTRTKSRSRSRSGSRSRSRTITYERSLMKEKDPMLKQTETFVSEKLANISQHFRDTLIQSTREMMRSSSKPTAAQKRIQDIVGDAVKVNEVFRKQVKPHRSESGDKHGSLLLNRPSSKFIPITSKEYKAPESTERPQPQFAVTTKKLSKSSVHSKASLPKMNDDPNKLDHKGIIRLRSLLEANTPELYDKTVKSGQIDAHRRSVDPNYPHAPLEQMKGQGQSMTMSRAGMTQEPGRDQRDSSASRRGKSVAFAADVKFPASPRPRSPTRPHFKNYAEAQTEGQGPAPGRFPRMGASVVQQRVGESVKTLDEANRVANALGSLMTRVGVARDINKPVYNTFTPPLPEPASTSGIGTMTDGPGFRAMPKIPEIKFHRDMSLADQQKLQELRQRSKTQNWGSVNY